MKMSKLVIVMMLLQTVGMMGSAWAGPGGHGHVSVMINPFWGGWYYQPQPYYYQPVIVESPRVYVEQQPELIVPAAPAVASTNYWYYCAPSRAYYPYVKECPVRWQMVSPQPPAQP